MRRRTHSEELSTKVVPAAAWAFTVTTSPSNWLSACSNGSVATSHALTVRLVPAMATQGDRSKLKLSLALGSNSPQGAFGAGDLSEGFGRADGAHGFFRVQVRASAATVKERSSAGTACRRSAGMA